MVAIRKTESGILVVHFNKKTTKEEILDSIGSVLMAVLVADSLTGENQFPHFFAAVYLENIKLMVERDILPLDVLIHVLGFIND